MKVGDKVRVIEKSTIYHGKTGKIINNYNNGNFPLEVRFGCGHEMGFGEHELELIKDPKQTEAEILEEIEADNFKRLAKKYLRLRIERSRYNHFNIILQCDGEILDKIELREKY